LGEPLKNDENERYNHYKLGEDQYTLFEHCRRAIEKGNTHGPHGLPLIGSGDWNDGMNRVGIKGKGESVWLAWFLYENHRRFADLCDIKGKQTLAEEHRQEAQKLKDKIEETGWDDHWYLRAYYDDGTPLGSHMNEECQIDSLPQAWSILTAGGSKERQKSAINSVGEKLVNEEARLIQLFTPPFDETDRDPGYIKGYPPGIRENGGQYTHAATWVVWALTKLKRGNEAYQYYRFLNPITHSRNLDEANQYAVEPYVVAADVYSRPPFMGHGGWTWYTGSSGWMYRLGIEAILGFKLMGEQFTMDPCIPAEWEGFKITFKHHGTEYNVEVKNPDHLQKGVKEIWLDGKNLENKRITIKKDSSVHHVKIILGDQ
jgi:cyclic beta-1,2-glucan synthetase